MSTPGLGPGGADVAGGLDPGAVLEADVHHDHVGQGLGGDGHGLPGRAGLGAYDHVLGVGQQQLDAVADDLVVVDQHDPQRWVVHARIVPAPPVWLKMACAEAVQEVLEGRLGHPVQQHPVHGPPDHPEGRAVAGADGQLGPVLAERPELDVGVQAGEQALQPDRLPGQGQRGHRGEPHRLAELDRHPPPQPGPERPDPDPDLGEQVVAALLGRAGHLGQPAGRVVEQGLFHLGRRQRQLDEVAYEHACRVALPRPGP